MSKDQNTIREAENNVVTEGLLLEKEVREGTTADKRDFMSVKLTIATNEDRSNQQVLEMFSMRLKSDGTENGIYNSLETIANEYKTVAADGADEADFVRTTTGRIGLNDYVGQDGMLRSFPQVNATFVNRLEAGEDVEYKNEFEVEAVVKSVVPEIDKATDEETGRVILNTYIPLYGGTVIPFEFVVSEDGSSYVDDNYEPGDTVLIYGDIINKKEKTVRKVEAAFGKDKETTTYNTVREFVVLGGQEPYDEDDNEYYDTAAIKQALVQREAYLEGLKEKASKKSKGKGKKKASGFDTRGDSKKKKADIKDDDLPF